MSCAAFPFVIDGSLVDDAAFHPKWTFPGSNEPNPGTWLDNLQNHLVKFPHNVAPHATLPKTLEYLVDLHNTLHDRANEIIILVRAWIDLKPRSHNVPASALTTEECESLKLHLVQNHEWWFSQKGIKFDSLDYVSPLILQLLHALIIEEEERDRLAKEEGERKRRNAWWSDMGTNAGLFMIAASAVIFLQKAFKQ